MLTVQRNYFRVLVLKDPEIICLSPQSQHISNTQSCKPKQLHLMTCAAVLDWFEQHEGLEYSKQLKNYNMGVPLGLTVVAMHIPRYL